MTIYFQARHLQYFWQLEGHNVWPKYCRTTFSQGKLYLPVGKVLSIHDFLGQSLHSVYPQQREPQGMLGWDVVA